MRSDTFTKEDIQMVINLYNANKSAEEIANITGRTKHAIHQRIYMLRKAGKLKDSKTTQPEYDRKLKPTGVVYKPEELHEEPQKHMSPRDMIKALYDLGYRIENNQLVCYVKQTVKLQDIIAG